MCDLTGVMNHISGNDGHLAPRLNTHTDMTRRMPRCRLQGNLICDLMLLRHDHCLARVKDRLHGIFYNRTIFLSFLPPVMPLILGE